MQKSEDNTGERWKVLFFPGKQQRAAETKLFRLENEDGRLQEVWFQGEKGKQLIMLYILEKYMKGIWNNIGVFVRVRHTHTS